MDSFTREKGLAPGWWTLILVLFLIGSVWLSYSLFTGSLKTTVPVTLTPDRSGLVMETNAKVKMRGVQVGKVAAISGGDTESAAPVKLRLDIDPDQIRYIPANVEARIRATTIFGAKFVDLVYPDDPSPERLKSGQVLKSLNVTTEVNTVFQNVVDLLKMVDPAKLNAVLSAVADAVRGPGSFDLALRNAKKGTEHARGTIRPL